MSRGDCLLEPLTQRELEILRLLAEGRSDKEIAGILILAKGTIKWYNKQIYSKLGVHSRMDAVDKAREGGLLSDIETGVLRGTVTFLFTDIEGSTRLWERYPEKMSKVLERHDALLSRKIEELDGRVFKTVGDAFCAVFDNVAKALSTAHALQVAILGQDWGETPIRIRMAVHTGTADARGDDYFGPPVNYVARLLSAAHGGQTLISAATQALVRDRLPKDLSLRDLGDHRLKDVERVERIYQLIAPDLPADFPPLSTIEPAFNNLPAPRTSFVGREEQIEAVIRLLGTTRLLTLTGPPGTGKTRLALRVAVELLNLFPDGVYFVELGPISDPTLVVSSIAHPFGVRETAGQPLLSTLQVYLQDKQLLLLIDNFEQVIEAAPVIGELLSASPDLKVLLTSREALRIYGEHEYPVPSLKLPDLDAIESLSEFSQFEALELFAQRARAVKPDFVLGKDNVQAVAEICFRLDGVPLAIELAAARSKLLAPEAMRKRLEDRIMMLAGGARDLPARLQTLRAAVDWSYDLLDPEEKTLFARLAVFQGGRSADAVRAICSRGLVIDVSEGLESLLNKSLLGHEVGLNGDQRFIMLEMIHEYAWERLNESGEAEDMRRRHAEYFLALAERAAPEMRASGHVYWSLRLRDEHNNLRTALNWSLADNDATLGLQLVGALCDFWYYGAHSAEGLSWARRALEQADEAPPTVQARAFDAAGRLSWDQGDHVNGKLYSRKALSLYRSIGDNIGSAWALNYLAANALASPGECKEGIKLAEEGLEIFRKSDDKAGIVSTLNNLGELARLDGDYDRADRAYREVIDIARLKGAILQEAIARANLSYVAYHQGDYEHAELIALEAITLFLRELENKRYLTHILSMLAGPVAAQGNPEKAARLLGASAALQDALGVGLQAGDAFEIEHYEAAVREQLDEATFQASWSRGRAMSLEEAVAFALGEEID